MELLRHVPWLWTHGSSYNFLSSVVPDLTLLGGIAGWWHHRNCHIKGCWRKGHPDPEHGHPTCRKHSHLS